MTYLPHICLALTVLYFVSRQVAMAACPMSGKQALTQVMSCLTGFTKISDFSSGSVDTTHITRYCNTSADTEVRCLYRLIDDCRRTNPTVRRVVDNAVNYDGIRHSIFAVCNNIDTIVAAKTCLATHQDGVTGCVASRYFEHQRKIESLKLLAYTEGVKWMETEMYRALCVYIKQLTVCLEPYGKYCGKKIEEIFDSLAQSSAPPVCNSNSGSLEPSKGSSVNAGSYLVTFAVVCLMAAFKHAYVILQ